MLPGTRARISVSGLEAARVRSAARDYLAQDASKANTPVNALRTSKLDAMVSAVDCGAHDETGQEECIQGVEKIFVQRLVVLDAKETQPQVSASCQESCQVPRFCLGPWQGEVGLG